MAAWSIGAASSAQEVEMAPGAAEIARPKALITNQFILFISCFLLHFSRAAIRGPVVTPLESLLLFDTRVSPMPLRQTGWFNPRNGRFSSSARALCSAFSESREHPAAKLRIRENTVGATAPVHFPTRPAPANGRISITAIVGPIGPAHWTGEPGRSGSESEIASA